jgi:hypothetical protein
MAGVRGSSIRLGGAGTATRSSLSGTPVYPSRDVEARELSNEVVSNLLRHMLAAHHMLPGEQRVVREAARRLHDPSLCKTEERT